MVGEWNERNQRGVDADTKGSYKRRIKGFRKQIKKSATGISSIKHKAMWPVIEAI